MPRAHLSAGPLAPHTRLAHHPIDAGLCETLSRPSPFTRAGPGTPAGATAPAMPGAVSLWMAPLAALGASTTAVLGSPRKRACSAPGRRSGGGSSRPGSQWRSLLWIVRTAWTAPCCSRALWAVWFPSAGKPEPPMHAPERWPYGGSRAGGHGVITSTVSRTRTSRHCAATARSRGSCVVASRGGSRSGRGCGWCRGGWGPGAGADGRSRPAPWPSIARRRERIRAAFLSSLSSRRSGTRYADAVNHSFIASVQASQWGGLAYSPAIRPRPLGPRQGGAFRIAVGRSGGEVGGCCSALSHSSAFLVRQA